MDHKNGSEKYLGLPKLKRYEEGKVDGFVKVTTLPVVKHYKRENSLGCIDPHVLVKDYSTSLTFAPYLLTITLENLHDGLEIKLPDNTTVSVAELMLIVISYRKQEKEKKWNELKSKHNL